MSDHSKRNIVAQWAFDTRPILLRFHLWLEDVEVEWERGERSTNYAFVPQGIRRCLAMASAATAMGTKLFGDFGGAKGMSKEDTNLVKKHADGVAAYVLSEALWHTTRRLPENHALMVCLGEGLMPKAGETPEMGANPLLGFGRVYARPEVAIFVDRQVRRLLNDPDARWDEFYRKIRARGITIWGAAVDTLENTSRFAKGEPTGPMSVLHVFDQPLTVSKPYESYMGTLSIPGSVTRAAAERSILIDFLTPRAKVVEAVEHACPGIARENIHVWTLGGESRERRLRGLWDEWKREGVHLVEDGWTTPAGLPAFNDSGTYAPTFLVGSWKDDAGKPHVFLCDGYAASAEAMQAASLSEVLDVDVSMGLFSPVFKLPHRDEYKLMKLDPDQPAFATELQRLFGDVKLDEAMRKQIEAAIREAHDSNLQVEKRILRADDFIAEKTWRVLAAIGFMCDDPYTGAEAVTEVEEGVYRVTTRLATRMHSVRITFTFRLMEDFEQSRLIFSPLLTRLTANPSFRARGVKVSDSGRIRNELQTMMPNALEYEGDAIRVHFDRVEDQVMTPEHKQKLREVLTWYRDEHPVWFHWLDIA